MNRNEINRQATRTAITNAFIELYNQNDINNVSLKDICELSSISKTMFYRYYNDKYSVLEEIENNLLNGLIKINYDVLRTSFTEFDASTSFPMFYESATYIKKNAESFAPMLKNNNAHFLNKWKNSLRSDFENFFRLNGFDKNNLVIITSLFASIIMGIFSFWLLEQPDISIEEFSRIGGNALTAVFREFNPLSSEKS